MAAKMLFMAVKRTSPSVGARTPSSLGFRSIRSFSSFSKVHSLIQTLKERGICSLEKDFVQETVSSVNSARENKIVEKVSQAGVLAGLILSGMTIGSTFATERIKLGEDLA